MTAAAHLTALRIFYRYLVEEEGVPSDRVPTAKVRSHWSRSVSVTVTSEEVARLLKGASRIPTQGHIEGGEEGLGDEGS